MGRINRRSFLCTSSLLLLLLHAFGSSNAVLCPTSGALTVSSSCTLLPGQYSFSSVVVQAGATLTLASNATLQQAVNITTNSLTVNGGGIITASGYGYPSGSGPGTGQADGGGIDGAGAAYGGGGGLASTRQTPLLTPGVGYGDPAHPTSFGSGASPNVNGLGGAGGGATYISVNGTVTVNGQITSNGLSGNPDLSRGYYSGGGAGGSIWLDCQTLTGTGVISASGGAGGGFLAGGGSGGRIAVYYNTLDFSFEYIQSAGGQGGNGYGGPGTVYMYDKVTSQGTLVVSNMGHLGASAQLVGSHGNTTWSYQNYYLVQYGYLTLVDTSDVLQISGNNALSGDGTAYIASYGTIDARNCSNWAGVGLYTYTGSITMLAANTNFESCQVNFFGILSSPESITVSNGATLSFSPNGRSLDQTSDGYYALGGSLSVTTGSKINILSNLTTNTGVRLFIGGSVTVQAGTNITGYGLGYPSGQGPGSPSSSPSGFTFGSGHGGWGGYSQTTPSPMLAYGSLTEPIALGSGAFGNAWNGGAAGASAVMLNVTGNVVVNGEIIFDGEPGGGNVQGTGGASGGSIWIICNELSGSGSITANGGVPGWSGGGGGGGRIAIYYNTFTYGSPVVTAYGGAYTAGATGSAGGAGTLYFSTSTGSSVIIDNDGVTGEFSIIANSGVPTNYVFDSSATLVVRRNGTLLFADRGDTLQISNPEGDGTGSVCSYGTLDASSLSQISAYGLCTYAAAALLLANTVTISGVTVTNSGNLTGASSLTVDDGGVLALSATGFSAGQQNSGIYYFSNSVMVGSGSAIHAVANYTLGLGVTIISPQITVANDGLIDATGTGYPSAQGPGTSASSNCGWDTKGGLYGGQAGDQNTRNTAPASGYAYGSYSEPISLGSGAGTVYGTSGGSGGGAIELLVSGTFTLDGTVRADGTLGFRDGSGCCTGGGSGGSVWIQANNFVGSSSALISASGGTGGSWNGVYYGGGGSGGRISVWYNTSTFPVENIVANGGLGGYEYGGPGTIYLYNAVTGRSTLQITNNEVFTAKAAVILSSSPTTWQCISLSFYLAAGGNLLFNSSQDTVLLTAACMSGDNTGQIGAAGTMDATALSTITGFGINAPQGSTLKLANTVSIAGVDVTINGQLDGLANTLTVESAGLFDLGPFGRTGSNSYGSYTLNDIYLTSSSEMRIYSNTAATPYGQGISLTVNLLMIDSTSTVTGSGLGYPAATGPGSSMPCCNSNNQGGAGHAGRGGYASQEPYGGGYYGSYLQPTELGSGGDSNSGPGGAGGSALQLTAGTLIVYGSIQCNGIQGYYYNGGSGGGSGGSIWITATNLTGSAAGTIQANGGAGGSNGGGGSGGRIAIYYTSYTLGYPVLQAYGGPTSGSGGPGAVGTIYLQQTTSGNTYFLLDNNGVSNSPPAVLTNPLSPPTYDWTTLAIQRYANLLVLDTTATTILNTEVGDGTGTLCAHGQLNTAAASSLTKINLCTFADTTVIGSSNLTVNGVTLEINGTLQGVNSVTISDFGMLVLNANGSTAGQIPGQYVFPGDIVISTSGVLKLASSQAGNGLGVTVQAEIITVGITAMIDALGTGWGSGLGPGASVSSYNSDFDTKGASYGGQSGDQNPRSFPPQSPGGYGSVSQPTSLGSGAGYLRNGVGGNGGGAMTLLANAFINNGLIRADGAPGNCDCNCGTCQCCNSGFWTGGGSGGSIWLNVGSLSGSGQITSNGGAGGSYGGGGGGGRVAVWYNTSSFPISSFVLCGGEGSSASWTTYGGPGTVYLYDKVAGKTQLVVNNCGLLGNKSATVADLGDNLYNFTSISLTQKGNLLFQETGSTIVLTETGMSGDGTAQLGSNGTIDASSLSVIQGFGLYSNPTGNLMLSPSVLINAVDVSVYGVVSGAEDISLENGALLDFTVTGHTPADALGSYTFNGTLTVSTYSQVRVWPNLAVYGCAGPQITFQNVDVQPSGAINGSSMGFLPSIGPGAGTENTDGSGAGHAGLGGPNRENDAAGGSAYGLVTEPVMCGSGGGTSGNGALGGSGGAVLRLIVNGTLNVDGAISFDGGAGTQPNWSGGGGSGGSIWITANQVTGSGIISANGGPGAAWGGGGSAGRIALYYNTYTLGSPDIQAYPGSAIGFYGACGSIYLYDMINVWGTLMASSSALGVNSQPALILDSGQTLHYFDAVYIVNGGSILLSNALDTIAWRQTGGDNTGSLCVNGYADLRLTTNLTGFTLCSESPNGFLIFPDQFTVAGNATIINHGRMSSNVSITVQDTATLVFDQTGYTVGNSAGTYSLCNLTLIDSGEARVPYFPTTPSGVTLMFNTLNIAPDAHLHVDWAGYGTISGPGAATYQSNCDGSGASHAGYGAYGTKACGPVPSLYGNVQQPVTAGSGGGDNNYLSLAGYGGGIMRLFVGTISLQGLISADGQPGYQTSTYDTGGGSGGSVWVSANSISGSGMISARGGSGGGTNGGGGGGGRVAVYTMPGQLGQRVVLDVAAGSHGYLGNGTGSTYVGNLTSALNVGCVIGSSSVPTSIPVPTTAGVTTGAWSVTTGAQVSSTTSLSVSGTGVTTGVTSSVATSSSTSSSSNSSAISANVASNSVATEKDNIEIGLIIIAILAGILCVIGIFLAVYVARRFAEQREEPEENSIAMAEVAAAAPTSPSPVSHTTGSVAVVDVNPYASAALLQSSPEGSRSSVPAPSRNEAKATGSSYTSSVSLPPKSTLSYGSSVSLPPIIGTSNSSLPEVGGGSAVLIPMLDGGSAVSIPINVDVVRSSGSATPLPGSVRISKAAMARQASAASVLSASVELPYKDITLEKEIGRGAYGVVYKGRWRGGEVAVKRLSNALSAGELSEFRKEAGLMANLRPFVNVVQFIGICSSPSAPLCIVTEFCEGGSLASKLMGEKAVPLDEATLIKIARGVTAGMLHLSSEGIVHRDLAARNILLTSGMTPKVSDFGMSRFGVSPDSANVTMSTVGPLRWMSPELLSHREYSEKSDVWSFGIVLWEMLARQPPYPNIDQIQVATRVAQGKLFLTPPPDSPYILASIMRDCLQFDPRMRPSFKFITARFADFDRQMAEEQMNADEEDK